MNIKDTVKTVFHLFCSLTVVLVLICAIEGIFLNRELALTGFDALGILAVSFAGSLPTLMRAIKTTSRRKTFMLNLAHFTLTGGIVISAQIFFGNFTAENAVVVVIIFLVIYITAYLIIDRRERKLADKLNERINAFHEAENATHDKRP